MTPPCCLPTVPSKGELAHSWSNTGAPFLRFPPITPFHSLSPLIYSWGWESSWLAASIKCGPRRATWPPIPPGLTQRPLSSVPCAETNRRRLATPFSAARPRPLPGFTTSKALPQWPRTPPSGPPPPSSSPSPPTLGALAPTSPRTCPANFLPPPPRWSSPPLPRPPTRWGSLRPRPLALFEVFSCRG